jgi:trehalose 6-phosphate synthase
MTQRQLPQREHEHQQPTPSSEPERRATDDKPWDGTGVVIVANRLPVEQRPDGTLGRSPGGLASALAAVASEGTHWIGWAGADADDADLGDEYLHHVALRPREVDDYYHGFANSLLWPLFHGRLRQPEMNRSWWRAYQTVNERYAQAVAKIAPLNGLVWVHDYHLLLTPALIRARRPDLRIGLFLHIPFPGVDLFATLPWRGDLVRGMNNADLLGFQTEHDAANAAAAIGQFVGDRSSSSRIREIGTAEIAAFPISIDVDQWQMLGERAAPGAAQRRRELGVEYIFAGVDRLDYTKGIDQRLRAFRELLDQHLLDPRQCCFVQVSVPSREEIFDYGEQRDEVEWLVEDINERHGIDGHLPVLHLTSQLGERELSEWYRAADCLVVTSYADGMNLVAKEFVAARTDLGASVVLSEFAGAAQEMPGALIVNPFDLDAVKQAMLQARHMPAQERTERMREMREAVGRTDVHQWASSFLRRLSRSRLRTVENTPPRVRSATNLASGGDT